MVEGLGMTGVAWMRPFLDADWTGWVVGWLGFVSRTLRGLAWKEGIEAERFGWMNTEVISESRCWDYQAAASAIKRKDNSFLE